MIFKAADADILGARDWFDVKQQLTTCTGLSGERFQTPGDVKAAQLALSLSGRSHISHRKTRSTFSQLSSALFLTD